MPRWRSIPGLVPAALIVAALVPAGCGGGSSKPPFCSNVTDLEDSVNSLKDVQIGSDTVSTLKADAQKVQADANAVVSSAKADFPNETSALQSSVSAVASSVDALPASPTPQELLPVAAQVASAVQAADSLRSATSSACD